MLFRSAFSDVFYLSRGLAAAYRGGNTSYLDSYSETALRRVWSAERFSWRMTLLLHRFPGDSAFDLRLRGNDLESLRMSEHALALLAEEYVGLPFEA